MGEVEAGLQRLGDLLMEGEFLAVVRGQGMDPVGQRCEQAQDGLLDAFGSLGGDLGDQRQPGLALGQRYDCSGVVLADDGVGLPVTDAPAARHDGRALVDGHLVGQAPSALIGPVALSARLLAA